MTVLSEKIIIRQDIFSAIFSDTVTQDIALHSSEEFTSSSVTLIYSGNTLLLEENKKAIERLKSFKKLESNWNSYGAEKPSIRSIDQAIRFIKHLDEWLQPVYFTAPGPNGEILVELKHADKSIEVFFNPEANNEYALFHSDELDKEGSFDLKDINQLLDLLDY